eukprot:4646636-Pyramimonas_sp.AAC.1
MSDGAGPILPGPRSPYWACGGCGLNTHWASRITCRCGAAAPAKVVAVARRNATPAQGPGNGTNQDGNANSRPPRRAP